MTDITANVVVSMPSQLFTMARSFKAVANGKIYIGKIDTDPVNPENQIPVYLENEDGSHVQVAQPIVINAAGFPVYNGKVSKFVTVQGHSMAVYDDYGVQQFYYPNVLKYDPDQFAIDFPQQLSQTGLYVNDESKGDAMIGVKQPITGSIHRTQHDVNYERISALDLGVKGDGVTDDVTAIREALITAATARRAIHFPDGVYLCSDFFSIPSHSRIYCDPGAVFKLTGSTNLGGFVVTGLNNQVQPELCEDVVTYNMTLDCNKISGENGMNGVACKNIRHYNLTVINTLHNSVSRGGRAFQCEGGVSSDVHVFNFVIKNCSIGVNYQGLPDSSQKVVAFSFHGIVMDNIDVPFSIYSQVSNPLENNPEIMSVAVFDVSCHNCGQIKWEHGDPLGAGIICGDRGYGLFIDGIRVVNESTYGGIGAFVRGSMFGVSINNADFYCLYAVSVIDHNRMLFDDSSSDTFPTSIRIRNLNVSSNLDFIVRSPDSSSIGNSTIDMSVNIGKASLPQLFDKESGGSSSAIINISDSLNGRSTGFRTLKNIFDAGNSIGLISRYDAGGNWVPVDGSSIGLSIEKKGQQKYTKTGDVVNFTMNIIYPITTNTDDAVISGLPFVSVPYLDQLSGSATIGIKSSSILSTVGVIPGSDKLKFFGSTGIPLKNSEMSGVSIFVFGSYLSQ
ncbi:hypothetical protein I0J80_002836 [Salmonella enterica]|nr:hypothetical protein [Salmonella enterica subsp. houtenae serovar 48:g,z51:-]EGP6822888.1 hypothetical protein [Salmonella enterica]EJQ7235157.1 hypothetical protein [Salmonella enterica subsp. enterica]EAV6819557.1 hypothetical protein [Salmonella enterica subsp. houtenae serovar 48:g,z51:-]EGP8271893.1 hypothetical protein [Salmonella enterica]